MQLQRIYFLLREGTLHSVFYEIIVVLFLEECAIVKFNLLYNFSLLTIIACLKKLCAIR